MNRAELVRALAKKIDMTIKDCDIVLDGLLETIVETVADGESVKIMGFGNFEPKTRAPRLSRNPHTGDEVEVPEKRVPVFRAGKEFKNAVVL